MTRAEESRSAADEANAVGRASGVIAAILVIVAGLCAFGGQFQGSGLALLGALAASIASVAGRPPGSWRWVGPGVIGVAMIAVIAAGFLAQPGA